MITNKQWSVPPILSPYLFWDTDKTKLDFTKNADFVIKRVFDLGTIDDLSEVLAYYDHSQIVEALVSAVALKENVVYLASILLHIPLTDFKCYTPIPSPQSF